MLRVSGILIELVAETLRWLRLAFRSSQSIQAENLFLRRQLALYIERGVKPRRIDFVTRIGLTLLSRLFDWRDALAVVRPQTLIRWHRAGWKLFWRLKSRPGRPSIPLELQALIRRMSNENPSWGEERIANELLLKIGIRVSARTVNKYLPRRPRGRPRGGLRWSTFLRLHAQGIIACDFFVAVTATFRLLYVFVVIDHRSRRLVHYNVTAHPSAAWALQQLREVIGNGDRYRFLIHDRDCIFASQLDESIRALGIRVLKSAPHFGLVEQQLLLGADLRSALLGGAPEVLLLEPANLFLKQHHPFTKDSRHNNLYKLLSGMRNCCARCATPPPLSRLDRSTDAWRR